MRSCVYMSVPPYRPSLRSSAPIPTCRHHPLEVKYSYSGRHRRHFRETSLIKSRPKDSISSRSSHHRIPEASEIGTFGLSNQAIAFEYRVFLFQAKQRTPRRSSKVKGENGPDVQQNKKRIVRNQRRK